MQPRTGDTGEIQSHVQIRQESYDKVKHDSLSNNPSLQTHLQTHRLPQESLAGFHGALLLDFKVKEAEDRRADDEEFHLGDVAANAGARAGAKGNEGGFLACGETRRVPAIGNEFLGVWAPDFGRAVNCVAWYGEDVAGLEGVAGDLDGGKGWGDFTWETHG